MGDTSAQVVALLNNGLASVDPAAKVTALQQVQELTVEKEPELLDNFFAEILQFQHDRSAEVRKQVVSFVEVACKKDAGLLPQAVPTLQLVLQDAVAAVKKRAVLANTNLYRPVLLAVVNASGQTVVDPAELWGAMQQMKADIVDLLGDANDGVRTSVLKFLELQILTQTVRTAASESKRGDTSGLEVVPAVHPVLKTAVLREDARASFELLVEKLTADGTSSSNMLALVTILSSLARLRPTYMERVVGTLVGLYNSPPKHLKPTQLASLKRALKTPMIALLKHSSSAEFHEDLVPVLEDLDVPHTTLSAYDRRGKVAARGRAVESEAHAADQPGPAVDNVPNSSVVNFVRLRQLPFPLIVELLMQSMKNLPSTFPDVAATAPTPVASDAVPPPAAAAAAAATAAAAAAGPADGASAAHPAKRLKMDPGEGASSAAAAPRRQKKAYRLEAVALSDESRRRMALMSFERLLSLEGKMTEVGARQSRELLIARMAAMISSDEVLDALVAYIVQAPKERVNLALLWLYHQYRAVLLGWSKLEVDRCQHWYDRAVEKILLGLRDTLDSRDRDHLVPKVMMEMPHFPDTALNIVQSYCEDLDEGRAKTGFIALHFLLKYRPPMRARALPVLLKYTRSIIELLRRRAIEVARKFWKIEQMRGPIAAFAIESMEVLTGVTAATAAQWSAELTRVHLELQFELCAEDPRLLIHIVDIYVATKVDAVKLEIMKSMNRTVNFDWSSPALLGLLNDFPDGAQDLLNYLLHVLTKKGRPSPALMAAVRKVYDRTRDKRLLISILGGMSKVETVSVLPDLLSLKDSLVSEVFNRVLGGKSGAQKGSLSPSEFLTALHSPTINVPDAVKAVNRCFDKSYARVFTHEVLAVSLQQLVDQTQLPVILMRTMIQALQAVPRLKGRFMVSLLLRLASKEIWRDAKLWKGFVRVCLMTTKESYDILLGLPFAQLEDAFRLEPKLREQLVADASKFTDQQRAVLPSETLKVLGLSVG